MAKSILIPTLVAAKDVDAYNRSFVSMTDIDNGNVFVKGDLSTNAGESQVYKAEQPSSDLKGLYMAFTAEDVVVTDELGNQYKMGNLDPRAFTNKANTVFSGFKPQVGDLILLSADGITGEASGNKFVVAEAANKLKFNSIAVDGLSFKIVETTYITVASANNIGSQRVTAYLLECVAN